MHSLQDSSQHALPQALAAFTHRYCTGWQRHYGCWPKSQHLYGIASPCIVQTCHDAVYWQPQPFPQQADLSAVEQALNIVLQPDAHRFYTTQLAGDMPARFDSLLLTLLQTWSEDDFLRVQENLIGHLVTQRRLKLSPTLFIATLEDEDLQVISLCNLTGVVLHEILGTDQRWVLCASLTQFLQTLEPVL